MNVTRIVLATGAVLALAACGGGSNSGSAPASSTSAPAAPSPAAAVSVDAGTAGRVCAAVNAMTNRLTGTYSGTSAIATAAKAYNISQPQVLYAIDHRCPQLKKIISPGG